MTQTPASPQAPARATGQRPGFPQFQRHTGPITALQFIERIRSKTAVPSELNLEDYIVAGDPTTPVTGIATTEIATFASLKSAAASGRNLVVTLESTFWSDNDSLNRLEGDTLFKAKRDFIRANNLVCFHLHDHWPAQGADGIAIGMLKELAWDSYVTDPANPVRFKLPPTTLLELARELRTKLDDRTLRVIGDPSLPVSSVAAKWGNSAQIPTIHMLNEPVDVVLVGYTHEWESVEYVQDMIATGQKKGMILLGEAKSQAAGMKYCAEWLKAFITEVPVEFIATPEPYWNLHNQPAAAST